MEDINKLQYWKNTITKRPDKVQPALIVGTVLAAILGGLTSFNPFIGIATSLVMFLLVLVVPRPVLIVYGLTLLLPLTAGFARGSVLPFLRLEHVLLDYDTNWGYFIFEHVLPSLRLGQALLVVGFILFLLSKPGRLLSSRLSAIDLAFMLFFLTGAVFPVLALYYRGESLNLTSTDNIYGVSSFQTLLGPLQYYLLYRIVVAVISSERQIKAVLELSFIACIIVSVIGILEKIIAPVKTLIETYYPPVLYSSANQNYVIPEFKVRVASTLAHYSGLGAYLTFTIIMALACYGNRARFNISPLLLLATVLLGSVTLILTGTFAAWIGLPVGAIVVFILIGRIPIGRMMIIPVLGFVIAAIIFQPFLAARLAEQVGPGATQGLVPSSLAFRIQLWGNVFLPAIGQHLLFGSGPNPAVFNSWSTEESQYLALLLRGGLLNFLSYFLLIGIAMVICWRRIKQSRDAGQTVAIALLAILVAISAMNVSAEYFTYAGGIQTIWTLLAVVVASGQFQRPSGGADLDGGNERQAIGMPSLARLKRLLDWHFVKDSTVVAVGSTVARVLGLLYTTLLTHFLKPDDFGFYQYSITLAGIVGLAAIASPVGVARFLAANAKDPLARDRYFSNGLLGVATLGIITLFISIPILWLMHALNLATIVCIFCLAAFYGYLSLVRGMSNAWKIGLTYTFSNVSLVIALFVVFGLFKLRTATVAIAIFGLTDLVPILVLEWIKSSRLHFRPALISKVVLLELTWFAVPIVLATGAYTIWSGLDMLLVENFYPHAAGSYAVAKTLSGAFLFVPSAISMVLMPKVATAEPNKSKRYSQGAVGITFLISLIGIAIVGIWGKTLIMLIFGQRYSDAYPPLLLLSAGMSLYAIYTILEGFIIGRGQPRLTIQALSVALISTTVAGFYLTPRQGLLGASLSFTIGAAFGTLMLLFNTWRLHRKNS